MIAGEDHGSDVNHALTLRVSGAFHFTLEIPNTPTSIVPNAVPHAVSGTRVPTPINRLLRSRWKSKFVSSTNFGTTVSATLCENGGEYFASASATVTGYSNPPGVSCAQINTFRSGSGPSAPMDRKVLLTNWLLVLPR